MVSIDTLEGLLDGMLWYHYEVGADVLYLRLCAHHETPVVGEETDDGLILLSSIESRLRVGLTVVNWWKRFGKGSLPDSISEIQRRIEPLRSRLVA
jgi:hypothetical protein